MPADRSSSGAPLARRRFLGTLAAAPAALAACAAAGAGGARAGGARDPVPPSRAPSPDAAAVAVRALPLAADAEPAFVFRAGARPGGR